MKITQTQAIELALKVLQSKKFTLVESETISKVLLWAQKRGSSQGLNKLFGWRFDKRVDAKDPFLEKQTDNLMIVNSNLNSHILSANLATDEIIKNIKNQPIYLAAVKNADNSCGPLGFYTEKLAKAGLVAIMLSAADPGVAPFGATEAIFGTNPISIAIPTDNHPVLLDMSTASVTWGDLVKLKTEGKDLPEGFAFDSNGKPTINVDKAMSGCVSTFDKSYKGSGLAMMIQILAGPLVGSLYSKNIDNCQYGSLIIAINPESFGDRSIFIAKVNEIVSEVKNARKAVNDQEILVAGEHSYKLSDQADQEGMVEIEENLLQKIKQIIES